MVVNHGEWWLLLITTVLVVVEYCAPRSVFALLLHVEVRVWSTVPTTWDLDHCDRISSTRNNVLLSIHQALSNVSHLFCPIHSWWVMVASLKGEWWSAACCCALPVWLHQLGIGLLLHQTLLHLDWPWTYACLLLCNNKEQASFSCISPQLVLTCCISAKYTSTHPSSLIPHP